MSTLLNQGLLITLIGMGLVFVALILLWGMMALMGRIPTRERNTPAEDAAAPAEETPAPSADARALHACAAAAAVAAALALQQRSARPASAAQPALTPWQAVRRAAQLNSAARFSNHKSRGSAR